MTTITDPAEVLWQLWAKGQTPDLGAFLARVGPLPLTELARVVRVDQRGRWQAGVPVLAEAIFQRLPELQADPELAVDVIFNEFLLREELGQRPVLAEYLRRFPSHAAVLKDQIELHRALATERPRAGTVFGFPPAKSRPAMLSENFGRYRILRTLGQGGMGTVYLAQDTQLQRQVALKVPRFLGSDDPETLERFYREARISATFNHPNLCPIYDFGEYQGIHYLTMPLFTGETLAALLQRDGHLSQAVARRFACLVARAVQVAHRESVWHRDLKPSNIMIQEGSRPIVMDFGLARRNGGEEPRLTPEGRVLGTCSYMAPEQFAGDSSEIGPASDVYSLGVILYEMLTGRVPFQGSRIQVLRAISSEPPPPPRQFRPDLDLALETACLKALAKDPAERFPSMSSFAAALAHLRLPDPGKQAESDGFVMVGNESPPKPRRRNRTVCFGTVAGAVIVALGAWLWISAPPTAPLSDVSVPAQVPGERSAIPDPPKNP